MSHLNSAMSNFFDLLLRPFQSLPPFWSILIFSLVTGIFMLIVYRYTSNQEKIKEAKDKIKAHLLEIRLFNDDLRILLSAQKNILFYNFKYMKQALRPMLFMIIPVAIILIQLDGWFGYRPLKPGESAIVSVKLADNRMDVPERFGPSSKLRAEDSPFDHVQDRPLSNDALSKISIEPDKGLVVETPPLRIPEEREVNWRVRATEIGKHNVVFNLSGHSFKKGIIVSDKELVRVSPRVTASSLWGAFLTPGEDPIVENSLIKQIEVQYPSRSIEILGWRIHWLVAFFVLSIVFAFVFKGLFRVEI